MEFKNIMKSLVCLIVALAIIQFFNTSCGKKSKKDLIFPSRIEVSSSRLLSPESPYFSLGLMDGDFTVPWISGDSLKNGSEFITLTFPKKTTVEGFRILCGYVQPAPTREKLKECNNLYNLKSKSRGHKKRETENKILFNCLYREESKAYSFPKSIKLELEDYDGAKSSLSYTLPEPNKIEKDWYWFEKSLKPFFNLKPIKKLKISIINQYYGRKFTHLALGELELFGKSSRTYSGIQGRKELSKWYKKNHAVIQAREFIFGKECRQVDGTRYIFHNNGDYEYITGLTSSTMGSERGKYFFDTEGIRIRFRRYEMFGKDVNQMNYSEPSERFLDIQYVDIDRLLIQGNRCRIRD